MKAMVYTRFGSPDVLQLQSVEKPVPGAGEVVIKIYATTVTTADTMMRRGNTFLSRLVLGLRKPAKRFRTLGIELAGEIAAVGEKVTRFKVGDPVFGFGGFRPGAYAQYMRLPETASLGAKPATMTYEEAAAVVDGASTAYFFLKEKANIRRGQRVLINGASGSIGTFAVQLAKHFGAHVTGVCSTKNVELVRSLGADEVIDYTQEDFTLRADAYDIIFDTVGKSSFSRCKRALKANGVYLITVGGMSWFIRTLWTSRKPGKRAIFAMSVEKNASLKFIRELVDAGELRAVIDRRYPLEQIADAHRYVETGRKTGNVVITVSH